MKKLANKLLKVMKACHYVEKDKANAFHKYRYVSAEAILSKVNAALVENGIATFAKTEILSSEAVPNAKGFPEKFVTTRVCITLVDTETGETQEISGIGSGQDVGDKAVAKAQTMATKYAWITSLNIATGDDPEGDEELDRRLQAPTEVKSFTPSELTKRIERAHTQNQLKQIAAQARTMGLLSEIKMPLWFRKAELSKTPKQIQELKEYVENSRLSTELQTQILKRLPQAVSEQNAS